MFDKFKGIQAEREIKVRERNNLEHLIGAEKEITKINKGKASNHGVQEQFYSKLKDELLKKIDFDENDLRDYILARTNYTEPESREALLAGMYAGCLLQLLTERNKKKGEKTIFHVNGGGGRFDYLFTYVKKIDEVIIENFTGKSIGCRIASHKGSANRIILKNITGSEIGDEIGHDHGKIKQIILLDSTGEHALHQLGERNGRINQVIAARIKGDYALRHIADHARINQAVGIAIKGDSAFLDSAQSGKINQIIGIDIKGKHELNWIGYASGVVSQVLYSDVKEIGGYVGAQEIICEETMSEYYQKNKKIIKAFELAKSMKDKDYPEIIKIAEQLYAIRCKK